ncbi:MAG: hypothetical protein LUH03_10430 [Oscillospiraceae bacterium]|nr:hypothetical protein [Oscillospiraceae bacterium]
MKKILAVATALVLAISSLCVFAVAETVTETTTTFTFSDVTLGGYYYDGTVDPTTGALTITYQSGHGYPELQFTLPSEIDANSVTAISFNVSSGSASNLVVKVYADGTGLHTYGGWYGASSATLTSDEITTLQSASAVKFGLAYNGTTTEDVTFVVDSVTVTTTSTAASTSDVSYKFALAVQQTVDPWSGDWWLDGQSGTSDGTTEETVTFDASAVTASSYLVAGSSQLLINVDSTSSPLENVTITIGSTDYTFASLTSGSTVIVAVDSTVLAALQETGATVTMKFTVVLPNEVSTDTSGTTVTATDLEGVTTDTTTTVSSGASSYYEGDTVTLTVTLPSSSYKLSSLVVEDADGNSITASVSGTNTATFTMPASAVTVKSVAFTEVDSSSSTGTTSARIIYVNEEYHGTLLTMNGKTYLLNYYHEVDNNGYCTVCGAYIGSETESEVITIDGVDYVEAFSNDLNAASGNWNSYTLGDSSFASALNTEGALLVIERDTETILSYVDGQVWDKFIISASSNVQLGTNGTTAEVEDVVAFVSDDGLTVVYDGATVYAAMEAAGIEGSSSYSLISNSSASYNITSVKVLIPVGSVVTETVDVDEPAEDTNSETEDDELDVDDTDAEEVTETNPTTGAVLALVPMAIAGFAVVASKRK